MVPVLYLHSFRVFTNAWNEAQLLSILPLPNIALGDGITTCEWRVRVASATEALLASASFCILYVSARLSVVSVIGDHSHYGVIMTSRGHRPPQRPSNCRAAAHCRARCHDVMPPFGHPSRCCTSCPLTQKYSRCIQLL